MADTKAEGPARAPTLKQLKAREQQLAARKARLRQELDQVTAEHKEVKARRVEAEGAEKAARPAKARAAGDGKGPKAAKAAGEGP
jgi:hypothetical protein